MATRRAELIIRARIATLVGERGFGWAEAIAIAEGRVLGAGRLADVEGLADRATHRWDLGAARVVLPAITDAHLHLATAALASHALKLDDALDRSAILERIARAHEARAAGGDGGGWLLGHGWSLDRMGGWPTAEDLDAVAPGRPVALWAHDHHSRWASSTALAAAGIGTSTTDPDGGHIRRDDSGAATGILHEHAAKLLASAIPRPSTEAFAGALDDYAQRLAELGVVGAHDPGEMEDDPALTRGPVLYAALAGAGRLPLRVHGSVRPEQLARAVELGLRTGVAATPADPGDPAARRVAERARVGWLKLFADGALGSRTAALLEPYEAADSMAPVGGPRGMPLEPAPVLRDRAQRAAEAGIGVQIHGIGDAAVRTALDILESLPAPAPALASPVAARVRHRVEHAQLVHPQDVPRFAAAGIAASVQPCHLASDAATMRAAWGARTRNAFPLRDLDASGALMPFGTDAPVEPVDPWPGIAIAITRAAERWPDRSPFHPEQAVALERAIRAACLDPALVAGATDLGRLDPGCRADLIVLDAAVVDEPVRPGGALASARPLATLIDGQVIFRSSRFDLD